MLLNGEHSLQSWPMDSISESVSLLEGDEYLAVSILSRANQIQNNLANLETADPENGDLFDDAYVTSHYIAGFGKIIKSEKIHHLGSLAELIADLARQFHSYSDHSMIYLTGLIVEKLIEVCEDLVSGNSLETDISDVVGECAIYLKSAIELVERQKREKRENRAALVSQIALETPSDIAPTNLSDDIFVEIDTEEVPEKIIIDPERIGLISDFCEEVWDSLQKSENLLIELENNPTSKDLINELFRAVHTIKGGSRLLEIKKIEKLSHELETVLDEVRSNRKTLDANMIDVALDCVKRIHNITEEVASREPINTKVNDLILKLRGNVASSISIKKSKNTDISKNIN
jgi:chemotaxis protein histidine kinase CheA